MELRMVYPQSKNYLLIFIIGFFLFFIFVAIISWKQSTSPIATTIIVPSVPPIPKGGVYHAYFDDILIKMNNDTVLMENFSKQQITTFVLNDRANVSQSIFRSSPGCLDLRQELETLEKWAKAELNSRLSLDGKSFNLTVTMMVPRSNLDVYPAGFDTLVIVETKGVDFNVTIQDYMTWAGSPKGLYFHSGARAHGYPVGLNRTQQFWDYNHYPTYTFDDWHTIGITINSNQIHIYIDGTIWESYVAKSDILEITSVSLELFPNLYI